VSDKDTDKDTKVEDKVSQRSEATASFALRCRESYPPHDIHMVLRRLRQSGRTGTLSISVHQGGVAHVEFCDEHVIASDVPVREST
jgi:hypothetical protein